MPSGTRRQYIPVGSTAASLPLTVPEDTARTHLTPGDAPKGGSRYYQQFGCDSAFYHLVTQIDRLCLSRVTALPRLQRQCGQRYQITCLRVALGGDRPHPGSR